MVYIRLTEIPLIQSKKMRALIPTRDPEHLLGPPSRQRLRQGGDEIHLGEMSWAVQVLGACPEVLCELNVI